VLAGSVLAGTPGQLHLPFNNTIDGLLMNVVLGATRATSSSAPPSWFPVLVYAVLLVFVAAILAALRRLRRSGDPDGWISLGAVLLVLPMFQPYAWVHHWVIVLVAIGVAVRLVVLGALQRWAVAGLFLAYLLLLCLPSIKGFHPANPSLLSTLVSAFWIELMAAAFVCLTLGKRPANPTDIAVRQAAG